MVWIRGFLLCLLIGCFGAEIATAHPEDEFCVGGDGMDPALCRALQNIDRSADPGPRGAGYTETETIDFERPALETFGLYINIGVRHILPGGLDHILFVLAMFFSARRFALCSFRFRPLRSRTRSRLDWLRRECSRHLLASSNL